MKLLILVLVSTFLVVGCGRANQDPAFAPYIEQWKIDSAARGITIMHPELVTIKFGEENSGTGGNCKIGFTILFAESPPEITINQKYWTNSLSEIGRKLLIYHELGHCVLGKGHSSDEELDIMNSDSMIGSDTFFLKNPQPYLDRYFH